MIQHCLRLPSISSVAAVCCYKISRTTVRALSQTAYLLSKDESSSGKSVTWQPGQGSKTSKGSESEVSSSAQSNSPQPVPKFSDTPAFRPKGGLPPALARHVADDQPEFVPLSYYQSNRYFDKRFFIVAVTTYVLILYIALFRPRNDLDDWLDEEWDKPLWKYVPAMEVQVLEQLIQEGKYSGKDATEYEARLKQLKLEILERQQSSMLGLQRNRKLM